MSAIFYDWECWEIDNLILHVKSGNQEHEFLSVNQQMFTPSYILVVCFAWGA